MKTLTQTSLLLIILQLALAPLNFSLSGKAYAQSASECADRDMVRDPDTGRCILPQDLTDLKLDSSKCEGLSGQAYNDCYRKNARSAVNDQGMENTDDVDSGKQSRYTMSILAGMLSGWYLLRNKKTYEKCKMGSALLILGGATSSIIAEIMTQKKYEEELDDIHKDYERRVAQYRDQEDKSSEAQTLALEMMIEQEKARKGAAETRKKGYGLATAMYASAAVMAGVEAYNFGLGGAGRDCMGRKDEDTDKDTKDEGGEQADSSAEEADSSESQADAAESDSDASAPAEDKAKASPKEEPKSSSSDSQDEAAFIDLTPLWLDKNFSKTFAEFSYLQKVTQREFYEMLARKIWLKLSVQSALAETPPVGAETDLTNQMEKASKTNWAKQLGASIEKGMSMPVYRIGFAGVMGVYAGDIVANAKENEDIADERIDGIKKILADYRNSGGSQFSSCTGDDRDNKQKPGCYCYNADGSPNGMRINRPVCKAFASGSSLGASDYGGNRSAGYTPTRVCLKDGGKVDQGCNVCKAQPQRCPAIASAHLGSIGFGKGLGVGDLVQQSNKLNTGRMGVGDLDAQGLQRMAAKMRKAKEKLAEKDKKYKAVFDKADKLGTKMRKALPKLFKRDLAKNPDLMASLGVGSSAPPKLPKELEKNEKIKKALGSLDKKSKRSGGKKTSSVDENYDFGFGDSGGGVEIDEMGAIMEKEFAIKGGINKNRGHNLFKILSLRYQRSGLRRLFDDEGKSEADAANEQTINEK